MKNLYNKFQNRINKKINNNKNKIYLIGKFQKEKKLKNIITN